MAHLVSLATVESLDIAVFQDTQAIVVYLAILVSLVTRAFLERKVIPQLISNTEQIQAH